MSSPAREPSAAGETRDHRRWLVGVGISLVFGIFSMVMALLSYSERSEPAGPSARTPSTSHGSEREPAGRSPVRGDRRR